MGTSSLDRAVRGQDAVLCALGHRRFYPPSRILSDGTRNLIGAMEAHGVRRHGPGVGSLLLTRAIPRADVAAFMLDQLTDDTYLGTAPGIM